MSETVVPQNALSIVRTHDASLFRHQCAALLFQIGQQDAAIGLFRSESWWEKEGIVGIRCQRTDVKPIRSQHQFLSQQAAAEGLTKILLEWEGCLQPAQILAAMDEPPSKSEVSHLRSLGSYGTSRLQPSVTEAAVKDFIAAKEAEGLIVTVTSMVNDRCLDANALQANDRGGGWTLHDWIGTDFLKLWRDSFQPGRENYYTSLRERLPVEQSINEFYYHIRRPSGALAEYTSSYSFVESFKGGPVRIAVSVPGQWRIIEPAPDYSEV